MEPLSLYQSAAAQARPFLMELAYERAQGNVTDKQARAEADEIMDAALDSAYQIQANMLDHELVA